MPFGPNTPVIDKATGRHGVILFERPGQGRGRRHRVRFLGRPDSAGVHQGPPSQEDTDEVDLHLGMTSEQLTRANDLTLEAMKAITQEERDTLLASKIAERDDPASTDHEILEAVRYVDAITEANS